MRITSTSASMRLATSAPSVSLSPNRISSVMTVSFSLMTGMTPSAEQRAQRRARVEIALAVGEVVVREQHLRGAEAVLAKRDSYTWTSPSGRPRRRPAARASRAAGRPAQPLHALGDRAARDQHDLAAAARTSAAICRPSRRRPRVEAAAFVGDEARADLDDDAPGVAQRRAHRRCRRRPRRRLASPATEALASKRGSRSACAATA